MRGKKGTNDEKPSTHIRITAATLKRLRAYRASQMALEDTGRNILAPSEDPRGGPPTWDAVITRLLDTQDAHRERARQQRERRREAKLPPAMVAPTQKGE